MTKCRALTGSAGKMIHFTAENPLWKQM